MKTMTIEELKRRGLKTGDIYYAQFELSTNEYDGWYLVLGNMVVGLNTKNKRAWRFRHTLVSISKIILSEENLIVVRARVSDFLSTFDESLISSLITNIVERKTAKYIHAAHFGNPKLYTWRVPEKFAKVNFKPGDIVEVDTMYGKQYVQVRETAEYEYDSSIREVLSLVRTDDLPF